MGRAAPAPAALRLQVGIWLGVLGLNAQAARALRAAVAASPENLEAYARLAETLMRLERLAEAAAVLRAGLRRAARSDELQGLLVLVLARQRRLRALLDELRRFTRQRSSSAEARLLLGALLARRGETVASLRCFRDAARLDPLPAGRLFRLGEALLGVEEWEALRSAHARARGSATGERRRGPNRLRSSDARALDTLRSGWRMLVHPVDPWGAFGDAARRLCVQGRQAAGVVWLGAVPWLRGGRPADTSLRWLRQGVRLSTGT